MTFDVFRFGLQAVLIVPNLGLNLLAAALGAALPGAHADLAPQGLEGKASSAYRLQNGSARHASADAYLFEVIDELALCRHGVPLRTDWHVNRLYTITYWP